MSRLVLVRHGRSSHVHTGWVDVRGFRAWREAYEAAGVRTDERAPHTLRALAGEADLIVAIDAARAVATAELLAPKREIVVSSLLRELDLEGPDLGRLQLPLPAWALAVAGQNLIAMLRGGFPSAAEAARITEAATWLDVLASRHALIVAVTHGSFRRELAARLARSGWNAERGRRSMRHWSTWCFQRGPNP